MKNVTSKMILAAAALTFSVTQTTVIAMNTGSRVLKIVNTETGDFRIALVTSPAYPKNAAEKELGARLVFKCADSGCALAQVWPAFEAGMQFSTPSVKRGEPMHLAVVRLRPTLAD